MPAKLSDEDRLTHHRESNRKWAKAHPEKSREAVCRWKEAHREIYRKSDRESVRKWQKANPDKFAKSVRRWEKAHRQECNAAHQARSKIPLADTCELCGAKAQHRHHPDYSMPLLVMHLCAYCHRRMHERKQLLSSNP